MGKLPKSRNRNGHFGISHDQRPIHKINQQIFFCFFVNSVPNSDIPNSFEIFTMLYAVFWPPFFLLFIYFLNKTLSLCVQAYTHYGRYVHCTCFQQIQWLSLYNNQHIMYEMDCIRSTHSDQHLPASYIPLEALKPWIR